MYNELRLSAGLQGRDFLEKLREGLKGLYITEEDYRTLPVDQVLSRLRPAVGSLIAGAQAGDANFMFLWAEFLFWGRCFMGMDSLNTRLPWMPETRDDYDYCLHVYGEFLDQDVLKHEEAGMYFDGDRMFDFSCYQRAADAGSVPAMCWLGWCSLWGIAREQDEDEARHWFDRARAAGPVESLEFPELRMVSETAEFWEEYAADEDYNEDLYLAPTPWRKLHGAGMAAYDVGCALGDAGCGMRRGLKFYQDDRDEDAYWVHFYLTAEKRLWMLWCACEGAGLKMLPQPTIKAWLADIGEAFSQMQPLVSYESRRCTAPEKEAAMQRLQMIFTQIKEKLKGE